jgi:hypothetical protein
MGKDELCNKSWCSSQKKTSSFRGHHLNELLIVHLAISIDICLADHLVNLDFSKSPRSLDLVIRELLSKICHHVSELGGADKAIAILIENTESFPNLLLT